MRVELSRRSSSHRRTQARVMPSASANSLTVSHSLCSLKIASSVRQHHWNAQEARLGDGQRDVVRNENRGIIFSGKKYGDYFPARAGGFLVLRLHFDCFFTSGVGCSTGATKCGYLCLINSILPTASRQRCSARASCLVIVFFRCFVRPAI
jgi:hypothetical protein